MRSAETSPFEHTSTNDAARPMPSAFSSDVVTASVGQSPSTRRNVGLFLKIPDQHASHVFMAHSISYFKGLDAMNLNMI